MTTNPWQELFTALQKPTAPDGAKTLLEIANESGASLSSVNRTMKKLVAEGTWQTAKAGPKRCAVYWPAEVKHGTGRNRAR